MTTSTMKRIPAVSVSIAEDQSYMTLTFANGNQLTLVPNELSADIRRYAMLHGLKQKLVDAAAISCNPDTGRSATATDKYEAVREVFDRIVNTGEWNKPREGGGNAGSILFKAVCAVFPNKAPDALREWLAGKTDAEKAALRANAKIAAAIAAINAEKTRDIDSDAMLDELGGGDE